MEGFGGPEEPPKMEEIITPEVLESIAKGYSDSMKCTSFHAESGSKVGDNFMSTIYAVDMKLEDGKTRDKKELKVMLKTMPRNGFRAAMINDWRAFEKESTMYQKVFPMLTQLQEEKGIPKGLQTGPWPKCWAAHVDGSTDYLALEDLRVDGFKMADRMTGFDFTHAALVLRQLARYHALSYAKFGGKRDSILEAFPTMDRGQISKQNQFHEMQQQMFLQSYQKEAEILKGMGEEVAASRLEKMSKMDLISGVETLLGQNVDVAVITHGDFWVNNMLFAYDDSDGNCQFPIQCKFVDFQIPVASSRFMDIFVFLLSSVKLEVIQEYERDLLMIYYAEFTEFAQRLGMDTKGEGLTWEKFIEEGDRYRFYGVCAGLVFALMFGAKSGDLPDMENMKKEDLVDAEGALKMFMNSLANSSTLMKVKFLALEQLPKCTGFEQYL